VEADPCAPDPNKDGKTDINDVAYSCQVLMAGLAGSPPAALAPASLHVPDAAEGSPSEADCLDEHCVRT
jgi:hypothetical protein